MNPDAYRIEILRERYEEHFETAQNRRRAGTKREAARYFDRAADTLAELADAEGTDRETQIARLQRAADILRSGEDLEDHFTNSQRGSSDDRVSSDDQGRRASSDDRDVADDRDNGVGATGDRRGADEDDEIRQQMESFICETQTTWDDIGGLEDVQRDLKRAIALGSIRDTPDAVSASDRILLFGPPGTGKTLLASAVAGSIDANFFQVELGNLLSKWYGESSKQITALFETAADLSPSVIFLDEVDSLTQSRSSDMNETSRRVLDTLLAELDGVEKSSDSFVLTLAATNTPWALDSAIRSRFPRRIHVPLPDETAATEIVRIHTVAGGVDFDGRPREFVPDPSSMTDAATPVESIARKCIDDGYTGRDIEALCREAVSNMVARRNPDLEELVDQSVEHLRSHSLDVGSIRPRDVHHAFGATTPSLEESAVARFYDWNAEFGSRSIGE